jgi:hypothetical protein
MSKLVCARGGKRTCGAKLKDVGRGTSGATILFIVSSQYTFTHG